jgi:glycolate oxidase
MKIMKEEIMETLKDICSPENVSSHLSDLLVYSRDTSPLAGFPPLAVVRPRKTSEVSKIMKLANEYLIPVVPRGAGTHPAGCTIPLKENSIVLDLTGMNQILEIDEKNFSVTVQPGITWSKLNSVLHQYKMTTGFLGPVSSYSATVGGACGIGSMGYCSAKYGSTGENVLGLEVVLPTGEVIRTGSNANPSSPKGISRYVHGGDITGLFINSHGIFGIITEITLNLFPEPDELGFSTFVFDNIEKGVIASHRIMWKRIPLSLIYADGFLTMDVKNAGILFIVVDGLTKEEVKGKLEIVNKICREEGGTDVGEDYSRMYYEIMPQSAVALAKAMKPPKELYYPIIFPCVRIPVLDFMKFRKIALDIFKEYEIEKYGIRYEIVAFAVSNSFLFSSVFHYREDNEDVLKVAKKMAEEFYRRNTLAGGAYHQMGILAHPSVVPQIKPVHELLKKIKKALDPNGILHPGMMGIDFYGC